MSSHIVYLIIAPSIPLVAALVLRHLFAAFLRQSMECFTGTSLQKAFSLTIGTRMAVTNGLIFCLATLMFAGCTFLKLPWLLTAAPGVVGVVAALIATIRITRETLAINVLAAGVVGLVCFAGGNLPLIVLFPAALSVAAIT